MSTVVIELDTTPPALSVGDPVRPVPDIVEAPYVVSDDGEVFRAQLRLLDGDLDMAVLEDRLHVSIPSSTPTQTAYIETVARDDVWNEISVITPVPISGTSADISTRLLLSPRIESKVDKLPHMSTRLKRSPKVESELVQRPRLDTKLKADPKVDDESN